ncbi:MAG: asparagine synthase [Tissierellaceae bacterium]|nr:asparagine synthase [Tissierellaceae bacterium]
MKKGLIPTVLGTAVTGAAIYSRAPHLTMRKIRKMDMESMVATGLLGFGLAHVVLGSIDLMRK